MARPLYRIDILLWYLNYFNSSFESRQNINSKSILVNGKCVKSNYYLKKGDIISISLKQNDKKTYSFIKIFKKHLFNNIFFSFLEVDYYSNNIVVIKDVVDLVDTDLQLLIEKNIDIKHLLSK